MRRKSTLLLVGLILILFAHGNATIARNLHSLSLSPPKADAVIHDITPREAWELIRKNQSNPKFVILDVRTPKEFFRERIPGAINQDFYAATFKQALSRLDPQKTYLVYCKSGLRSRLASELMEKLGFKNIYNMKEGIEGWKNSKLPLKSGM